VVAVTLGTAAAAAILLAVWLPRPDSPTLPVPVAAEEPYPVLTATDVEIVQVDDEDRSAVVVGQLPAPGSIDLLDSNEVTVNHIEQDQDGMMPRVCTPQGSNNPMIVAPLAYSPNPKAP
jgi:hypothetical protein